MAGRNFKDFVTSRLKDNPKLKQKYDEEMVKTLVEVELESKLRKLREEKGLTQTELAKILGTTQSVISKVEKDGYSPSMTLRQLIKYVIACGGSIDINIKPRPRHTISKRKKPTRKKTARKVAKPAFKK